MKLQRIRVNFVITVTIVLIMLFVYAALIKLADYETFKAQLGQSPILTRVSGFAAWSVPVAELLIAMLLSVERTRFRGLVMSLGLMTAFSVYIILVAHFSYYIPCACGGVIENLSWTGHLILNLGIVSVTLMAILVFADDESKGLNYSPGASG